MAYMGRVAVEKNIDAFLRLDLPGTKLIIGNGPARAALAERHPEAMFVGFRFGDELAAMLDPEELALAAGARPAAGLECLVVGIGPGLSMELSLWSWDG